MQGEVGGREGGGGRFEEVEQKKRRSRRAYSPTATSSRATRERERESRKKPHFWILLFFYSYGGVLNHSFCSFCGSRAEKNWRIEKSGGVGFFFFFLRCAAFALAILETQRSDPHSLALPLSSLDNAPLFAQANRNMHAPCTLAGERKSLERQKKMKKVEKKKKKKMNEEEVVTKKSSHAAPTSPSLESRKF